MRQITIIQNTDHEEFLKQVNEFFKKHAVIFWQDRSKYVFTEDHEFTNYYMIIEYEANT